MWVLDKVSMVEIMNSNYYIQLFTNFDSDGNDCQKTDKSQHLDSSAHV